MRIALGQLWQESNTFNPLRTTRANFEAFGVLRGDAILREMAETNELGGMIQSLRAWPSPPELVGLVRLPAWPAGTLTAETFDWIKQEIVESVQAAGKIDAVLLALHGSLVSEEHADVEGEILQAVREVIGKSTPLVATLDLHAHVTPAMIAAADAQVLFHTIPHVDVQSTGRRGAELLRRMLLDGARPTVAWQPVPVVLPAEVANSEEPGNIAALRKARLQFWEQQPGVLSAGVATVQPWLDVPQLGSAVVVVTDNDQKLASEICQELAADLWQAREQYLPQLTELPAAVQVALHGEGLTVLSDSADATTSGSIGNGTAFLAEVLKHDWPRPALLAMFAPHIVEQAVAAGVGVSREFTFGTQPQTDFVQPLTATMQVDKIFPTAFTLSGHLGSNLKIDLGTSVLLRHGNVCLVVTTRSGPHFAPELFRAAGLEPFAAQLLVAKSPCGFRAAYREAAARILNVRSPGAAPADFWNLPFQQITHPVWPWDDFTWVPKPLLK
ncbi:M81 family metallopeptidase [Anatilimnocola floriformis]|uniref:M81 family metallopeptidase n=1 Tax=Anatilimnocola floriformis TaxID=2948575 RepID=UPI0020C293E6|nr:M81 family metallopeptidase [Anatilimnocola floriformis]